MKVMAPACVGGLALVALVSLAPALVRAALNEESLAPQEMPAATPTPTPAALGAPALNASPSPAHAEPSSAGEAQASPAEPSPASTPMRQSVGSPAGLAAAPPQEPTEPAPAVPASDQSLDSLISSATSAERAASLRLTETARKALYAGRLGDAVRSLSRAVSIDPTNPYAYFYLGRTCLLKRDYQQALTFFERAELGLGSEPKWLAEATSYEGLAYEEQGDHSKALLLYQRALESDGENLTAGVGVARLTPAEATEQTAPTTGEAGSASAGEAVPPPPQSAPPPGPPPSLPPPPPPTGQ